MRSAFLEVAEHTTFFLPAISIELERLKTTKDEFVEAGSKS